MYKMFASAIAALAIAAMIPNGAYANRHNGKVGQQAMCKEKIGAKHLSKDLAKTEWKKCMEDANAYQ